MASQPPLWGGRDRGRPGAGCGVLGWTQLRARPTPYYSAPHGRAAKTAGATASAAPGGVAGHGAGTGPRERPLRPSWRGGPRGARTGGVLRWRAACHDRVARSRYSSTVRRMGHPDSAPARRSEEKGTPAPMMTTTHEPAAIRGEVKPERRWTMSTRLPRILTALCGILGVVALVAHFSIPAQVPPANATVAQVTEFAKQNHATILVSAWLEGIGSLLFVLFVLAIVHLAGATTRFAGWI